MPSWPYNSLLLLLQIIFGSTYETEGYGSKEASSWNIPILLMCHALDVEFEVE